MAGAATDLVHANDFVALRTAKKAILPDFLDARPCSHDTGSFESVIVNMA